MTPPPTPAPYPPARDAWRFPPPPVSRRWLPAAWVVGVLGVVVVVSSGVAVALVGSRDVTGVIDDPRVVNRVDQGCAELRRTVVQQPVRGTPAQRAAAIRAQDRSIERMVEGVERLGERRLRSDRPTQAWLNDWRTLVRLREDVADALADGRSPRLMAPRTSDGDPLVERMDAAAALTDCTVPRALVRTDLEDRERSAV